MRSKEQQHVKGIDTTHSNANKELNSRKKQAASTIHLSSFFRKIYHRADFPATLNYDSRLRKVLWKVDFDKLDYHYILPVFFTGLGEPADPQRFLVVRGIEDLIEHGSSRVLPVIPQLILPIKGISFTAKDVLRSEEPRAFLNVATVLSGLVRGVSGAGLALLPYYRQILPSFNKFINSEECVGDHEFEKRALSEVAEETLRDLEMSGGPLAYGNIKMMVPTYQSVFK